MKKDAYYFSHDTNAFLDPRIRILVYMFGIISYAMFWIIIEMIASQKDYKIKRNNLEEILFPLLQGKPVRYEQQDVVGQYFDSNGVEILEEEAGRLSIELPLIKKIIQKMIEEELLLEEDVDGTTFLYSQSLLKRMIEKDSKRQSKVDSGRIGGIKSGKTRATKHCFSSNEAPLQANEAKESKVKERKVKKIKEDKDTSPSFDLEAPIKYLNEKADRNFNVTKDCHLKLVLARYKEGRTLKDFKLIIDRKIKKWSEDEEMCIYLRPSTLFNATNFENYMNEKEAEQTDVERWGNL